MITSLSSAVDFVAEDSAGDDPGWVELCGFFGSLPNEGARWVALKATASAVGSSRSLSMINVYVFEALLEETGDVLAQRLHETADVPQIRRMLEKTLVSDGVDEVISRFLDGNVDP